MENFFEINGLNYDELKSDVAQVRTAGHIPFFHFTRRAGTVLKGPLIDEILSDLYPTFDKRLHVGYLVPDALKTAVEHELEGYGG